MLIKELKEGDIFIIGGDFSTPFLRVKSGACNLVSEDFFPITEFFKVEKIERWVVYREFIKYEIGQDEVNKIIDNLIVEYRTKHE